MWLSEQLQPAGCDAVKIAWSYGPFHNGFSGVAWMRVQACCYKPFEVKASIGLLFGKGESLLPAAGNANKSDLWKVSNMSSGKMFARTSLPCACGANMEKVDPQAGSWTAARKSMCVTNARSTRLRTAFHALSWSKKARLQRSCASPAAKPLPAYAAPIAKPSRRLPASTHSWSLCRRLDRYALRVKKKYKNNSTQKVGKDGFLAAYVCRSFLKPLQRKARGDRGAAWIVHPAPRGRRMSIHAGTKAASASSTKLRPQGCHESAFALSAGRRREGSIVYRQDFVQAEAKWPSKEPHVKKFASEVTIFWHLAAGCDKALVHLQSVAVLLNSWLASCNNRWRRAFRMQDCFCRHVLSYVRVEAWWTAAWACMVHRCKCEGR